MGYVLKIAFLGFLSSFMYFFIQEASFSWDINIPIKSDKTHVASKIFDEFKFLDSHPFCYGYELISENQGDNERVYEIQEEIINMAVFNHQPKSRGVYKKINNNHYKLDMLIKYLIAFRVKMNSDYHIETNFKGSALVEKVKISGPLMFSFVTKLFAQSQHRVMLEKIKSIIEID